jgi:cytochrome c oxidase subunit 2
MLGRVRVVTEREYNEWLEAGSMSGEGMTPAEFGAKLYTSKACITCHAVDSSNKVGPHLNGIFGRDIPLDDGRSVTVDENYTRESILNPQASIVAGYDPVMPTYQGLLNDKQIDALIAYIKSLKDK